MEDIRTKLDLRNSVNLRKIGIPADYHGNFESNTHRDLGNQSSVPGSATVLWWTQRQSRTCNVWAHPRSSVHHMHQGLVQGVWQAEALQGQRYTGSASGCEEEKAIKCYLLEKRQVSEN